VLLVLSLADLRAFVDLEQRVRWQMLPLIGALVLVIVLALGWRWHTLMREKLSLPRSLIVTALGLAGNQLLPLRGGDALRVVMSSRGTLAPSLHAGVSALALEKVFDLLAVAAFGLASTSAVLRTHTAPASIDIVVVAAIIVAGSAALLLAARAGWLNHLMRVAARSLRLRPKVYAHLIRPLHYLRQASSPTRLARLLIETGVLWLLLYVLAYQTIAAALGMTLGVSEAMLLLFAGALGLAVPAAPSGLGTFHAAIVSAFVLLGRSTGEGLLFAVAVHGVFFVGIVIVGAAALPWASTRALGLPHREPR
jgi:uncharacterized protein (TIRG00374 family)